MKIYCQSCFKKTEYKFTKPSFCSSCGHSFSETSPSNKAQAKVETNELENNYAQKIKELENEINALKSKKSENYSPDGYDQDDYSEEDVENFSCDPNAVSNFKKSISSKSSGLSKKLISVEDDYPSQKGVTFGSLFDFANSSKVENADFEGLNDSPKISNQSRDEILKQLREEASSEPRVIDIN